jgi:crotonobetainyl-CoA:carnitine CoA-transferase CaiB-like acyl-CoA transferase
VTDVAHGSRVGVLAGIEVLDLTWGIAGPMATMLLADHGALVTKIEPPGGDPFRAQAGYHVWHRGKRSAVLDLKSGPDRDTFGALAERADVVIESFAPGVTERLGIDYPTLSAANDRLVYCSITAYGRGTRDAGRPGYDALVQARTGLQWEQQGWPGGVYHLTGKDAPLGEVEIPNGAVDRAAGPRPVFVASRWPSVGACHLAAIGISAALLAREKTGHGQWVETSLLQGAMGASAALWQRAENPDVPGYASWIYDGRAPKGLFQCADGRWVYYAFPSPGFVFNAAGQEELRAGEGTVLPRQDADRLGADQYELAVVMDLYPRLRQAFRRFTADEWVRVAAEVGVPLCHVLSPREAFSYPPFLEDGCVVEIDDPEVGRIRGCGVTYHLASSPGRVSGPVPGLGEHTAAVLSEAPRHRPRPPEPTGPERALPTGPLSGIRVLDLGIALAGPWGAQVLSDLGADVIRVNALYDDFLIGHQYICGGRGKRSVAVNLKDERGKAIVYRLAETADVAHLNIRGGAARRLGIDYESMRALNPRLIYCHTTGYERGERAELPSNDGVGQSEAGVTWADGGGDDGGAPFWSPTALGDIGNGYLSAVAVIQALYERERTGRGQSVHTSITYAGLMNSSYTYLGSDGKEGESASLDANQTGLAALYHLYATAEGWLCLAAVTAEHWNALCAALGRDDLRQDPRFASAADRGAHDEELTRMLQDEFAGRSAVEWVSLLEAAGVPAEVSDPTWPLRMFDDPELIDRGWVTHYDHPELGRFDQHGLLWDFSATPSRIAGRPPMLGEHTTEILTEAGFSPDEIADLIGDGVVLQWQPMG